MNAQIDLAKTLNDAVVTLKKIATESSASVQAGAALQAALTAAQAANGMVTPELADAVKAVVAQIKVADDVIPDAAAAATPPVVNTVPTI